MTRAEVTPLEPAEWAVSFFVKPPLVVRRLTWCSPTRARYMPYCKVHIVLFAPAARIPDNPRQPPACLASAGLVNGPGEWIAPLDRAEARPPTPPAVTLTPEGEWLIPTPGGSPALVLCRQRRARTVR